MKQFQSNTDASIWPREMNETTSENIGYIYIVILNACQRVWFWQLKVFLMVECWRWLRCLTASGEKLKEAADASVLPDSSLTGLQLQHFMSALLPSYILPLAYEDIMLITLAFSTKLLLQSNQIC